MLPAWSDELLTGDETIDSQHKSLFALAERVCEAMTACKSGTTDEAGSCELVELDALADAVYGLTDYVVQHFADEEALMREAGYPGTSLHVYQHEELSRSVLRYMTTFVNGDPLEGAGVAEFIIGWLTGHIGEQDKAFVSWRAAEPRQPR